MSGLPSPKFLAQAKPGLEASYMDGAVKIGRNFFLKSVNPDSGSTVVHEITHLDKTHAYTQRTAEKFLAQRGGNQLTSAAADRADKLKESAVNFMEAPFTLPEVQSQVRFINNLHSKLEHFDNNNVSRILLEKFHVPGKGTQLARAIFGVSDSEAERQLIVSTFPKSELKNWTSEKSTGAQQFLGAAFDRAESTVRLRYDEAWDNYYDSLHEREAHFNEFVARQVLKLHLPQPA
jgi:hypothetical protein